MDAPGFVAEQLADQLEAGRRERFFGWPERLFVKLNALFPSLVDRGSRKSARIVRDTHSPTQPLATSFSPGRDLLKRRHCPFHALGSDVPVGHQPDGEQPPG